MRNVLILGSGRSGTSMTAGVLAKAGYFMGDALWEPPPGNPKGIFEDRRINAINEAMLGPAVRSRPRVLGRWVGHDRPVEGQRWLARIPAITPVAATPELEREIRALTAREPYCFKDPRFCYTLGAWRPCLRPTVFVCVFRDPGSTARSMLTEVETQRYLRDLRLTRELALQVWTLMYGHVLETHRHRGEWLFLHYEQVLRPEGLDALAAFTGAEVDRSFPEPGLRHQRDAGPVPPETAETYALLCELAGYNAAD